MLLGSTRIVNQPGQRLNLQHLERGGNFGGGVAGFRSEMLVRKTAMYRFINENVTHSHELTGMSKLRLCLLVVLLSVTISGCARFDLRRNIPWQETSDKPVRSVVAFWTEAVIERTSGPPYRGFGGRLLFYPADMSQPVKVQGTIVVYAFDEDLPPPENLKPVRRFVFTNEQLQEVYSDSKLGPSYNLLIPWEEFSPKARRVSLIVRYIPENGPSVVSEQVKVFLPGLDESMYAANPNAGNREPASLPSNALQPRVDYPQPQNVPTEAAGSPIRPTSYQEPVRQPALSNMPQSQTTSLSPAEKKRRMETLTLNISPRLGSPTASPSPTGGVSAQQGPDGVTPQGTQGTLLPQTSAPSSPSTIQTVEMNTPAGATMTQDNAQTTGRFSPMNIPPSPGELIKDLNRQPPTRFEPYRPLVPEGGVSQAPTDRWPSAQSP